ncbi:MAG: S9 family peptidase [Phycisphaerae bacterium]|nr:S9 family peptidase [Phycisphaerae bacterium]
MPPRCIGIVVVALAFAVASTSCSHDSHQTQQNLVYPETKQVNQVDVFHGVEVADPYRWLEDDNSEETAAWVKAQNAVTFPYLESIPAREKINARLTKLWNYEKYSAPTKKGARYFFMKNDGLQNQYVLYTTDSLDGEARVLLDPNKFSEDGTVALAGGAVSKDGELLAYGVSVAGSDWQEYHVRNVETAEDLSDHLKWIKFSGASWAKSGKGFFYSRYDEPKEGQALQSQNYYHKLFYHKLGTPQEQDKLIYDRPDEKDWMFGGEVTDDGQFLIIGVGKSDTHNNAVFYKSLVVSDAPVVELLNEFDAQYEFIDNDGPVFWFKTDADAPRGRVIAIDIRKPERENWREIIAEAEETLQGVNAVNDMFVASYLKDAHTMVKMYNLLGKPVRDVDFPGVGSAGGFSGERKDKETFYVYTSFNTPPTIYRYDMVTGESTLWKRPNVDYDPDDYVSKQVFYASKDGTRVPMFITHKKGLKLDGSNPTYLYGYGGFDYSLTPYFSISNLAWMEMGGVFAMANIRGGGEYGKAWHDAGRKLNKQNVFDDFIAAAEWLIDNKYTRPAKLAIGGASNGGLLVGACMTQRPDLFGAALPAVGVMDMLRFHKFTIGHAWVSDYGTPDDPEEFEAIYAYSPLHNLKKGTRYPATMITTADHDDRVVPAHSFKFAAALQAAQAGDAPVLIRIETRAGHGAGKPTWMVIEEIADQWAFLVRTLGVDEAAVQCRG